MDLKKDLIRYYLLVFLPFLFVWAILKGVGVAWYNQLLVTMAYFWPVTVNAPGVSERVYSKKYRFSLLRLIYLFDLIFKKMGKKFKIFLAAKIISSLAPIVFGVTLVLISKFGDPLFIIFGVFLAEFILEIRSRFKIYE